MGFDMYLYRKVYFNFTQSDFKDGTVKDFSERGIDVKKVEYIYEEVAYWRKAWGIHEWFMESPSSFSMDEQEGFPITRQDLKYILIKVQEVLGHCKMVGGKMQYSGNDFFDDGSYDENKYNTLLYTQDILLKILTMEFYGNFYYETSC